MRRGIEARTGRTFRRRIASEEWYLWDNYGYVESGTIHIYAQAADRRMCRRQEDRYWVAYWRHFVSDDNGSTWRDEGPAICPRDDPDVYDAYTIWSGSVLLRDDGTKMAAYTGLAAGRLALQSIAIAVSDDGYRFQRVSQGRPLLSAELDYDELRAAGYYLGPRETLGDIEREADGTFLCLRDPFLFVDADATIHLFFGAKAAPDGVVVRAVGHAVFVDGQQMTAVQVLPPQLVPDGDEFNQLELPNVFRRNASYYLVVSATNLAYIGQPDLRAQKTVRIYRSNQLDGGWQPYGNDGRHIILGPESQLYGLNIIDDPSRTSNALTCRAFWVGESWLPPSLELRVGGDYPELICPDDLLEQGEC